MKEFLDYFNSQDKTVMEFVETKEFFDYSISNSMTIFHWVIELKGGQRTQAKKEIEVYLEKPRFLYEKKLDTQLNRESDISRRNDQGFGSNKVQSDGKPIIVEDVQLSANSKRSVEVHKITADDGKSKGYFTQFLLKTA